MTTGFIGTFLSYEVTQISSFMFFCFSDNPLTQNHIGHYIVAGSISGRHRTEASTPKSRPTQDGGLYL